MIYICLTDKLWRSTIHIMCTNNVYLYNHVTADECWTSSSEWTPSSIRCVSKTKTRIFRKKFKTWSRPPNALSSSPLKRLAKGSTFQVHPCVRQLSRRYYLLLSFQIGQRWVAAWRHYLRSRTIPSLRGSYLRNCLRFLTVLFRFFSVVALPCFEYLIKLSAGLSFGLYQLGGL